jgi:hypothetical protein
VRVSHGGQMGMELVVWVKAHKKGSLAIITSWELTNEEFTLQFQLLMSKVQ